MFPSIRKRLARGQGATSGSAAVAAPLAAVVACAGLLAGAETARAQTCLEQIVVVQDALKQQGGVPKPPPPQAQSVGAQDSQQPTAGSLEAAGVTQPQGGAWGALNEAMNLQAAGNEQGCLEALARARKLGGIQ